jgi:hypothetical protein
MRTLFILLFLFVFPICYFGQVSIRTGEDIMERGAVGSFIGNHDGRLYCFGNTLRKAFINVYSQESLNFIEQMEVPRPEYNGKTITMTKCLLLNGEFLMMFDFYDKDSDTRKLLMQNMSIGGKLEGSLRELSGISASSKKNSGAFSIRHHEEQMAISFIAFPPFEKYASEKLAFYVYDESMQPIWDEEIELPFRDRYFGVSSYVLDNDKNIWAMCSFNEFEATKEEKGRRQAKSEGRERGGKYSYSLIKYNHETKGLKEIKIELEGGNQIVVFDYVLTKNGKIDVVGSYGNEQSKGDAVGIFFLQVDATSGKVEKSSLEPLDKALITSITGEKNANKGRGVASFVFRDFVAKESGGLMVAGEIYYDYQVCTTDPRTGATNCSRHYVYGTIVVLDISTEGQIVWTTPIPKFQHTVNDGGIISGYMLLVKNSDLIFLYNDSPKNFKANKKEDKVYSMPSASKAVTTITTVSSDGKLRSRQNNKLNEIKMVLCPRYTITIGEEGKERHFAFAMRKKERLAEIVVE